MRRKIFVFSCICLATVALINFNVDLPRIKNTTGLSIEAAAYAGQSSELGKAAPSPGPCCGPEINTTRPLSGGAAEKPESIKEQILNAPSNEMQKHKQLDNSFIDNRIK